MSREFYWEYRFTSPDAFQAMDDLMVAVEAVLPECCYGCGFADAGKGSVAYMYRANKAKAKWYADQLDSRLGVHAELVRDSP